MRNMLNWRVVLCLTLVNLSYYVMWCGDVIDVVHFREHLGNKLYDNIYKHDMKALIVDFIYVVTRLLLTLTFARGSVTLSNIHYTYCSSLYDIELFNFNSSYMSMTYLYIIWRKVIKRIYRLSNRTHNFIIMKLGGI